MGRRELKRDLDVASHIIERLSWQRIHEIQVDSLENHHGRFGGASRLVSRMNSAQRLEMRRVEALHADRKPIDARAVIAGEFPTLERSRIAFERDFRVGI